MRYFIRLAYKGAAFHGWQSQPNAISVQQAIEEALSTVLRCHTSVVGAGRTDSGVHAACMYAHFDSVQPLVNKPILLRSLNTLVGWDIVIHDIIPVTDDAHARFDATSRTYKYLVTHIKNPFISHIAWFNPSRLDYVRMNEAAAMLLEVEDFTSFAKLHSDARTNICHVTKAVWQKSECILDAYEFTISADRFLRNMVRAVVGTLVDVGRGKISLSQFREIVEAKDRCSAGTSMPAHGLTLYDITYPQSIFLR